MEIRVPCTHCGKVLIVPCESANTVGVCPSCHQRVIIAPRHPSDTPNRAADTSPYLGSSGSSSDPPLKSPASSTASNAGRRVGNQRSSHRPKSTPQQPGSSRDSAKGELQPPKSNSSLTTGTGLIGTVDPLVEEPTAVWFVRAASGGQYGPATNDVMRTWIAEGRVGFQSLVWRSDWADWLPAERVFNHLTDVPKAGPSASKAARYLEKRNLRNRFRPLHYVLFAVGLLALVLISVIIIF